MNLLTRRAFTRAVASTLGTLSTAVAGVTAARWNHKAMYEGQLEMFEPLHGSYHPGRLDRFPERIYAEVWEKHNERSASMNLGFTTIEHILNPEENYSPSSWPLWAGGICRMEPVTERDARVAASVIQWLGTNCGVGFLSDCERRIELERGRDRGLEKVWRGKTWHE